VASALRPHDEYNVARLKRLRDRSISNPQWRDARLLRSCLSRDPLSPNGSWPSGSAVELEIRQALRAVDEYLHSERTRSKRPSDARAARIDGKWAVVLVAVDQLIARAEDLNGRPIKPRAT
jgi:hypothetical protein